MPLIYDKFRFVLPLIYDKQNTILPLIYDKKREKICIIHYYIVSLPAKYQVFMDMSPEDIAIRIWSGNYSVDNVKTPSGKPFRLVNIPFYMIGCLNEILGKLL